MGALTALLLACGVLSAPAANAAELPQPVAHYRFDALASTGNGAVVPDVSGNGHDAALVGTGATTSVGPLGDADPALTLPGGGKDSTAAYVALPSLEEAFAGASDATLSFWASSSGGSSCQWAATLGTAINRHLFASPNCGGFLSAVNVLGESRAAGGAMLTSAWTHVALVLRGGETMTVYKDGVQVAQTSALRADVTAQNLFSSGSSIGGYLGKSFYPDPYFAGSLDDVRIFDVALEAEQVPELLVEVRDRAAQRAAEELTLGDTSAVTTDLRLPLAQGSATVSWQSSDPAVISATGAVVRDPAQSRSATLTATVTIGTGTATKEFTIVVPAQPAQEAVDEVAAHMGLPARLASGTALPGTGTNGTTLTWSSSSPGVSVQDGVVSAPQGAQAVLAAQIERDGVSAQKELEVTILPEAGTKQLLGYTRTEAENKEERNARTSYSLHLALGDGTAFTPLNENDGIVFARNIMLTEYQASARAMLEPTLFPLAEGGYGILGVRTTWEGKIDDVSASQLVYITSDDLVSYTEVGLVEVNPAGTGVRSPSVAWDSSAGRYLVSWNDAQGRPFITSVGDFADAESFSAPAPGAPAIPAATADTDIDAAVPSTMIAVDAETVTRLENRFGRIVNTTVAVDAQEIAQGEQLDLSDVRAELEYTDGSTATRAVDWDETDLETIDTSVPGTYEVDGTVRQTEYPFPFIIDGADPEIVQWEGQYLYTGTITESLHRGIWMRTSDTIAGLADDPTLTQEENNARNYLILDAELSGGSIRAPFWASELHVIDGKLTYLFAGNISANGWKPVAYAMQLREGGDPTNSEDWEDARPVLRADGGPLAPAGQDGISLDMTYFEDEYQGETRSYVVWSGGIGGNAVNWIATIDPSNPWVLTSEPVRLQPLQYGWDYNNGDVTKEGGVQEGAHVIIREGMITLSYSGASVNRTYVLGRMTATPGADLLDPASWKNDNYPTLTSDWDAGIYGTGHNSFVQDEDGNDLIVFHARNTFSGTRDTVVRRIHWAVDGYPIFDMTRDEEVLPENRAVTVTVTVAGSEELAMSVTTSTRCAGGKVYLVVKATNDNAVPVGVVTESDYGTKTFASVAAGRFASGAFATRASSVDAGTVTVTATAEIDGTEVSTPFEATYPATTCG